MPNHKLRIAYKGTRFAGWQKQKNAVSIQGILEQKARRIFNEPIRIIASGRTDSGVHAKGQIANFHSSKTMPPAKIMRAFNALLPGDIRVLSAVPAAKDFHARYDAKSKVYRYTINNGNVEDVFGGEYTYFYPYAIDIDILKKTARHLIGTHDFKAFQRAEKAKRSSTRRMLDVRVRKKGSLIMIDLESEGFLYNMVRSIVGTMLEISRGKFPRDHLKKLLKSKNRNHAGPTVPGCGLCLVKVRY